MASDIEDIKCRIAQLDKEIAVSPQKAELYYQRGKLHWKAGDKASAMTDFNTAVNLDPDSDARTYIEMVTDIMDFYNTDLYNP